MAEIIVTGAGRGIGLALCQYLSGRDTYIYGLSRSPEALRGLAGCEALELDITDSGSLHILYERLKKGESDLRVLIHNAGMLVNKPFAEFDEKDLMEMTRVNFLAPLQLTQGLLPWLGEAKEAHVIYIGSMGGYQGSVRFSGLSVYSALKSAGMSLMESLAAEFSGQIRFNAFALGAVKTEMLAEAFPNYRGGVEKEEVAKLLGVFVLEHFRLFNGKILTVAGGDPEI